MSLDMNSVKTRYGASLHNISESSRRSTFVLEDEQFIAPDKLIHKPYKKSCRITITNYCDTAIP